MAKNKGAGENPPVFIKRRDASMKPTLVVMAAGMGSRFGGLKQIQAVTGQGEVILEFSVCDALSAGFGKIVLVIKKSIEKEFEEAVGKHLRKQADIYYAYQELDSLPGGHPPPAGRIKPWGTGHAVLAAKDAADTPFAVINADDYYGKSAYAVMADFLTNCISVKDYAMVGYRLGNTLTDHGSVARGVCEVEGGFLKNITERKKIIRRGEGAAYTEDGENWHPIAPGTLVSMQLFGFHPSVFGHLERGFYDFLSSPHDPLKDEYLLPGRIGQLIREGEVNMRVLDSADKWFGVTYKEDLPAVAAALKKLRERGEYPECLR
jgi:NDP-sugar pyrophosphorylase family protein